MSSQIAICLIIAAITIAFYIWGKFPMGAVALFSTCLFALTKCVSTPDVLGNFGNKNAVVIVCMFIVSAGLTKTQFISNMAAAVNRIAKGSLSKILIGYMLLAVLIDQFIGKGVTEFAIVAPLLGASVDQIGVKRSKVMYPLGIMCLAAMGWAPIGPGIATVMETNGMIESIVTGYTVSNIDPFLVRMPAIILIFVYLAVFGTKMAPDEPIVPIAGITSKPVTGGEKLPPLQEKCGYIVFFATCIGLLICSKIGVDGWVITLTGAVLMVLTGVLRGNDLKMAFPLSFYAIFVGSLTMGTALTNTGAADLLGGMIANAVSKFNSTFVVYLVFFMVPFIMTQFMMNRAARLAITPVVIAACAALGISPVGPAVLVMVAATTAYCTPMACPCIPQVMAAGGYDFKSVLKQSIIPSLIMALVSVAWVSFLYPIY